MTLIANVRSPRARLGGMPRYIVVQVFLVVDLIDDITEAFGSLGGILAFERAYTKPITKNELLIERSLESDQSEEPNIELIGSAHQISVVVRSIRCRTH